MALARLADCATFKWVGSPSYATVSSATDARRRYFLYSHDGAGLGHTRRNLAIAGALRSRDPSADVVVASGIAMADDLGVPPGVRMVHLPPIRKDGASYQSRASGFSLDEVLRLRAKLLAKEVDAFEPDVLLADKHPLGLHAELAEALAVQRARGGRTALGLRDVLDDAAAVLREYGTPENREALAAYDCLLVYGDRDVFDTSAAFASHAEIPGRLEFTGYVLHDEAREDPAKASGGTESEGLEQQSRPQVLVTTGGGEDGLPVIAAALEASRGAPWQVHAITGPLAPTDEAIDAAAREVGATLATFEPNMRRRISEADVVVCMGGYNTLVESVSAGTPTICVPRTTPRKEQAIRANTFADRGFIAVCDGDVNQLRASIEAALLKKSNGTSPIDIGGADRTAAILEKL